MTSDELNDERGMFTLSPDYSQRAVGADGDEATTAVLV